jgi:glycosyltransferase involved in cell wall biosynthesis
LSNISIITPTFNRKSFLNDIYESLLDYENDLIEWIIIDDGSTDNTFDLVRSFNKKFTINYIYQENSGKHIAVNKGIELARNSYLVILDSDDIPLPSAFNKIQSLLDKSKNDIVGIGVNMCDKYGNIIGKKINNSFQSTIQEAYLNNIVTGDKWFIWKTDFIKKYKFPIYDNEKFVPEGLLYNRLSRLGFQIMFHPDVLLNARYQIDGYSNNIKELKYKNFNGFLNFYTENLISDSISINKYYLKSLVNINILILNKSKKPFKILLLLFFSLPILLFTLIFYKKFYYKSQ